MELQVELIIQTTVFFIFLPFHFFSLAPYSWATYGGSIDLWNTAWTVDEINSDFFGVRFQCLKVAGTAGAATQCQVDAATMRVYFTRNPIQCIH